MSVKRKIMALALVAFAAWPASAMAATEIGMGGCPQGYLLVDRDRGPDQPGPSYLPGEQVTLSGTVTDSTAVSRDVVVRFGSEQAPEVGRAALESDGSWKGITFKVPEDTRLGVQRFYVEARKADGSLLPAFPLSRQVRIGAPVPAPKERTVEPQNAIVDPKRDRQRHEPAPTVREQGGSPRSPAAPTPGRPSSTSAPAFAPASPVADASGPTRRSIAATAPATARARPTAEVDRTGGADRPSRPPAPVTTARPSAPSVEVGTAAVVKPVGGPLGVGWMLSLALLTGVAGLGVRALWRRRSSPPDAAVAILPPPADGPPDRATPAPAGECPVEAELQAMIASHQASEECEREVLAEGSCVASG